PTPGAGRPGETPGTLGDPGAAVAPGAVALGAAAAGALDLAPPPLEVAPPPPACARALADQRVRQKTPARMRRMGSSKIRDASQVIPNAMSQRVVPVWSDGGPAPRYSFRAADGPWPSVVRLRGTSARSAAK